MYALISIFFLEFGYYYYFFNTRRFGPKLITCRSWGPKPQYVILVFVPVITETDWSWFFVLCRWDSAYKMVWSGRNRECFSDGFARAKSRRSFRLLWEEVLTKDGLAVSWSNGMPCVLAAYIYSSVIPIYLSYYCYS